MTTYAVRSRNATMVAHIYDSRLNHMSAEWASKKAREIEKVAKANLVATGAIRSGHLWARVHARRRKQTGGYTTVRVIAGANYAAYVHEGTYGPIVPKNGPFMWVPKRRRGTQRIKRVWVRGQDANPFLSDAMFEVLVATQLPLF
jgi:hypothetical protein